MTAVYASGVQESSTVVGVGAITLGGAASAASRTFSSAFAGGSLVSYSIQSIADATQFEAGIGTFNAEPNTISRTQVFAGSNGTLPVNFSAGTKIVTSVSPPAVHGDPYAAEKVYAPGDVVQYGGAAWYALQASTGVAPVSTSPAWAMLGGTSAGAQGPPGPAGTPGQIRFTGNGPPPAVISGASPGDLYLDYTSGIEYQLS